MGNPTQFILSYALVLMPLAMMICYWLYSAIYIIVQGFREGRKS